MYAAINGIKNNKSVYIMQSYRKENGQTSSRVYRKLGRLENICRKIHRTAILYLFKNLADGCLGKLYSFQFPIAQKTPPGIV